MSSHPQSAETVQHDTQVACRHRIAVTLSLVATLLVAGCSSIGGGGRVDYDPTLVNGERAFGEEVPASEAQEAHLVMVSDDMKTYLDANVGERLLSVTRFKKLFHSLSRDGYFSSTYDADKTFNASDTFTYKAGNCLSYTNMFLAMARESGLHAYYQIVRVPPSWDADSGYLIRYTHINVLVKGVKLDKFGGGEFTVDFNAVHPEPDYHRKIVSDQYAESLFYANRSVNLIRAGQQREGFANLRRAIELVPDNPDLWINLGAFYGKRGNYQAAIDTYDVALTIDAGNKGAISGLSRAYGNLGDEEQARYYADQVKRYREKNAFYHFALAQAQYERENYDGALDAINTAIGLKRRNARFYFMRGLAEQKLGDTQAAKKSFRRAERLGSFRDLKLRYVNEFAGVTHTAPG
jgi:tetratricopeptide (TPR) repeat protein